MDIPNEDAKTTPKPMANGPPMDKNFSLGAQAATVDKPWKIIRSKQFIKQCNSRHALDYLSSVSLKYTYQLQHLLYTKLPAQ